MRYVVTGAAGFIGSHLAGELQRAGHDVLGVDSYTDYYERARKERNAAGIDVLEADLADAALPPILAGADGVFHLAGQPGVRASWGQSFELYLRRNVLATQRVFEAAADAGVRVVFASSSSVYGDAERYPTPEDVMPQPISPYGITKLACEQLAFAIERARGLESVSLRYFTVYGPRQRPDMAFTAMLEALARRETFRLFGDGSAARSFTYVGDAVAATIAAMERGRVGGIYNVGGGDEATMNEAIELAERISGRKLDVERTGAAQGDVRRTKADVSKAEVDLGWLPETPLEAGMQTQWEWAAVESPALSRAASGSRPAEPGSARG
jgi:nucleoside-diphosphate-sugar epimerase